MKRHLIVILTAVAISLTLFVVTVFAENVLIFRNGVDSPNLTVAKGAAVTWHDRTQLNARVEFTSLTVRGVFLQATRAGLRATFMEPGIYEYTVYLSPESSAPHQLQGKVRVK